MKRLVVLIYLLMASSIVYAQGISNNWLMGYMDTLWPGYSTIGKGRINFMSVSDSIVQDNRKMKFNITQGNISDRNGNLLMSSNGIWIADAMGDTMLNGGGLNPGLHASNNQTLGLNLEHGNVFLPYPGDSLKYLLFHLSGFYGLNPGIRLYYSVIDISLNNGLGAVVSKNNLLPLQKLGNAVSACRHANGRDWWIVAPSDSFNVIHKVLFTSNGLAAVTTQTFVNNFAGEHSEILPSFSPDGKHFAFTTSMGQFNGVISYLRYFDFDRCSGNLTYIRGIQVPDTVYSLPVAFSANSKILYFASYLKLFQLQVDSINAPNPVNLVATYDGFTDTASLASPVFGVMYLASNSSIYYLWVAGTSRYLSYIKYSDSVGVACDVYQHAIFSPCFLSGSIPNHPNYFLGSLEGSACDTLSGIVGITKEPGVLKVFPNPSVNGAFGISYSLAQNKTGLLQVIDVHGKIVHEQRLPHWSTFQQIEVPKLSNGIYALRLQTGDAVRRAKVVIQKE